MSLLSFFPALKQMGAKTGRQNKKAPKNRPSEKNAPPGPERCLTQNRAAYTAGCASRIDPSRPNPSRPCYRFFTAQAQHASLLCFSRFSVVRNLHKVQSTLDQNESTQLTETLESYVWDPDTNSIVPNVSQIVGLGRRACESDQSWAQVRRPSLDKPSEGLLDELIHPGVQGMKLQESTSREALDPRIMAAAAASLSTNQSTSRFRKVSGRLKGTRRKQKASAAKIWASRGCHA